MLYEATMAMLILISGMWAAAVWASFQEDTKNDSRSGSMKGNAAA